MKRFIYSYLLITCLLGVCITSCESNSSLPDEISDETPRLNKSDSLAMVNIYQKIGPWGHAWDLKNIQTWGGVDIALDLSTNQYRIVGFNFYGTFHGTFPDDFRKLTELRVLGLGGGTLSGQIPSWIGELTNLTYFYTAYNQMSGPIPPEIGKLTHLEQLSIGENYVYGSIPEELVDLTNLSKLTIFHTKVSGTIPKSLSKLDKIKQINLDKNQLSGEFPMEILKENVDIGCSDNNITKLSFDIWKDESKVPIPDLQGNRLSGEIPEWVLSAKKWSKHNFFVDRQQQGYGYTNYIKN